MVAVRTDRQTESSSGGNLVAAPSDTEVITIQVVVHIVYFTDEQNVSDAQIQSQFLALNADFGSDDLALKRAPEGFRPMVGRPNIRFELATTDATGQKTSGITRRRTKVSSFTHDDRIKSALTGGTDPWPADRYLNVWVAPMSGGMLDTPSFRGDRRRRMDRAQLPPSGPSERPQRRSTSVTT